MFRPAYNTGEDLDEYERMRQAALSGGYNPELGDVDMNAPPPGPPPGAPPSRLNPETMGSDPSEFESVPGLMDALLAQPGPPNPPPPDESADMSFTLDEADSRPDMSFSPESQGIYSDPEAAQRTPAMSPYSGRPADQLAPGEGAMAQGELKPMPYSGPIAQAAQGRPQAPVAPQGPVAQAAQQPTRTQQRPMSAASAEGAYDPGVRPPSHLATFLNSLPGAIAGLVGASAAPHTAASSRINSSIARFGQENQEMAAADDQARLAYGKRKQWLTRMREQDQAKAAAAQKASERQGVIDQRASTQFAQGQEDRQFSLEARDVNSEKSQLFRQAVEKSYPQLREQLGDKFDQLTPANAGSIQTLVDKAKAEAEAGAKEKARLQKNQDAKDFYLYKQQNKKPTVNVGMRLTGPPGADLERNRKALEAMYPDGVPQNVLAELENADRFTGRKKLEEMQKVLTRATDDARQDKGAGMRKEKASFEEKKEYYRQSKLIREGNQEFARSDKIFKDMGLDMSKFDGQNVPGYGRVESWLHTALQGEKGQQVRQRIKQHVASLSRRMSGLAMTEGEQKRYTEIAGAAEGMSDKALIDGYMELKAGYKDADKFVRAAFKDAAAEIDANLDETPAQGKKLRLADGSTAADTPANRKKLDDAKVSYESL